MTRTVLIAGSSRGIGAAAARHEAARGSRVILHGRSVCKAGERERCDESETGKASVAIDCHCRYLCWGE